MLDGQIGPEISELVWARGDHRRRWTIQRIGRAEMGEAAGVVNGEGEREWGHERCE